MLLRLAGIEKRFGERTLFAAVDLAVGPGDRVGLVGPNGAGKTSLLRIAAGDDAPDAGLRTLARGARVGLLRQEIDPSRGQSVREEVATAFASLEALEAELRALEDEMAAGGEVPGEVAERYDLLQHRFEHARGFEREARIERVLAGLGFAEEARARPLSSFSGGWLMRVELAKLLLAEPDVLLLDEPTNHLDLPSIEWFEETLLAYRGGVVVISHDRTFLRRHVRRVAELVGGRYTLYPGGYDFYLAERERRREELLARHAAQERRVAEVERFIERFRAKATKATQVQSRVKMLEKMERIEVDEPKARRLRLRIPEPTRAGAVPIQLAGVHKSYGDKVVYRGLDFALKRGERLALVGPNGAGKSTLLRILAGVLPFERGARTLGHRVEIGFYAQHQLEALDLGRTVQGELERVAQLADVPRLRGHLGAFLFSGDDVEKPVSVLSGGEKARLALAKMLLRPANVLVLDEPTNHLDVEACAVLEEALAQYRGTLVFISHDRSFINALATRIVEVRDGRLREFLGNYDDYQAKLAGERPAAGPETPGEQPAPETAGVRRAARERKKSRERAARRLEKVEAEILAQEQALEAAAHRLGDPELYRDPERVRALEAERARLREAIAALYKDWERLAAEVEALAPEA
jgi:ATP-binding cassette subfamily F protein 3